MASDTGKKPSENHGASSSSSIDRRDAIRLLSTLGGAAIGTLVLPPRWNAPRLEFGVLPAHAQCTAAPCTNGSLAVPFDTSSPPQASFGVTPYGFSSDSLFVVQFDPTSNAVTVTPATNNAVVSAVSGSVAGGVLSYTWSATNPVNTVNLTSPFSSQCVSPATFRMTLDMEITPTGNGAYTLNVRNLNSTACSFN